MKKIYLVRHGETCFNADKRMLGRIDVPLNENGKKQASFLAERLKDSKLSHIYSSPLNRCMNTTRIINNINQYNSNGPKISILEELIEHAKGDWDGLTLEKINELYPQEYSSFLAGEDITPPGGENFKEVLSRVKSFLNVLEKNTQEEEIDLVVSHGGINRVILGYFGDLETKQMYDLEQDNCCLNIITLEKDKSPNLEINLTNHLKNKTYFDFSNVLDDTQKKVMNWFETRTYHHKDFNIEELIKLKKNQKISVVIPTKNEEKTIENVVRTIRSELYEKNSLIDEILVIDSDSEDSTLEKAKRAGAKCYKAGNHFKENFVHHGKGENMWLSLYLAKGDIIAWVDADIENIEPRFVTGIIGPLIKNPEIDFVKSFYERPIKLGNSSHNTGGGRVTEICVRPMFNHFFKELTGFIQPLSGEYAGRRTLLEQLPFSIGYGVEVGLLTDIVENFGLEKTAQVDLDVRVHRNHSTAALGKMAFGIQQVIVEKMNKKYGLNIPFSTDYITPYKVENDGYVLNFSVVNEVKRSPIITHQKYREKFHKGIYSELNNNEEILKLDNFK